MRREQVRVTKPRARRRDPEDQPLAEIVASSPKRSPKSRDLLDALRGELAELAKILAR